METDLSLAGTRVFIVEDEALILFTLQDMLEELGCKVVASALRIDEALAKGGEFAFDVAILDVNVAGGRIQFVGRLFGSRRGPVRFRAGLRPQLPPYVPRAGGCLA